VEHTEALQLANQLVSTLGDVCKRIEIAGSIRRGKPEVKDIEIVAVPFMQTDMFGAVLEDHSLDVFDFSNLGKVEKNGHKYKKIALYSGISLDLFIVTPPADWGVQYMIRTGPADFSQWMVSHRAIGGALPDTVYVKDGSVWSSRDNSPVHILEEEDFFQLCGLKYVAPELRAATWRR